MNVFILVLSLFTWTVMSDSSCSDDFPYENCQLQLRKNSCNQYCRKTCGFCKPAATPICKDLKKHCQYWKSLRYCESNNLYHTFMTVNCKKTCQLCDSLQKTTTATTTTSTTTTKKKTVTVATASQCRDIKIKKECQYWKTLKYCESNNFWYKFMTVNCPKTCQFCNTVTAATTRTASKKCKNSAHYDAKCRQWKTYCRKPTAYNPNKWYTFMVDHCKLTCGFKCTEKSKPMQKKYKINEAGCGVDGVAKIAKLFVVNGRDAIRHKWRWQVGLYSHSQFFCGGSLVTPLHIVTAAHCLKFRSIDGLSVIAGDYERGKKEGTEQERSVTKVVIHKDYNTDTFDNDIALITLNKPVDLNTIVGTICIPESEKMPDDVRSCYITGWGRGVGYGETEIVLQEAEMPIINNKECGKRNSDKSGKSSITSTMLCAGFPDKLVSGCQGDSGGPFVCKGLTGNWVLEGAVSWGSAACDASHRYTVFARVRNFSKWIKKHIG